MGRSPQIIPPLVPAKSLDTVADVDAWHVIQHVDFDIMEAQDNLLKAKIAQAVQANKQCSPEFLFKIGTRVHLSTLHH